mmetsp:Transcript_12774/g.21590  ORF Transcript_12774/g.21590 Transcript_12774/m.21590 type:complete len:80 (-) Transcript_12774:1672-1911(-)
MQDVAHVYYDFHKNTAGDRFYMINELVDKVYDKLTGFDFFVKEKYGRQAVLRKQSGVFRTNCIDCLDRTNVTQAKLALK